MRRSRFLSVLGVWVAFALAAPAAADQPTGTAPNPATGRKVATEICSACHLVTPDQRGPAPDGVPTFQAMANDPAYTVERIEAFLFDPHPPMPRIYLPRQTIHDISAYIRGLKSK